jgi:prepilin-type processing-associated H-X9-DG protein
MPDKRMPISYAMNGCASSWYPADDKRIGTSPPVRWAQLERPSDTFLISESQWHFPDMHVIWLFDDFSCGGVFSHAAGKMANFVFYDGHAKSKKWISTLYPLSQNNWQATEPSTDPNNRRVSKVPGCDYSVPAGPTSKEFQTANCQAY